MRAPQPQGIRHWLGRGVRRLLLRFYPADFRRKFAPDWLRFLAHQRREERYARRGLGAVRFWKDVVADVAVSGLQLRWAWAPLARMSSLTPGTRPTGGRTGSHGAPHRGRRSMTGTLFLDLRIGLRSLRKSPGFTTVAVLSLALGIGATTTIFSVVNAAMLRPLRFPDPDRIVVITDFYLPRGQTWNPDLGLFRAYREQSQSFEQLALGSVGVGAGNLPGPDGAERVNVAWVGGPGVFRVLGVEPILGRTFVQDDFAGVATDAAILSYGFWQRRYGGDPTVIGQRIPAWGPYGLSQVIVGVMPPGTWLSPWSRDVDLWMGENTEQRPATDGFYTPIGRLKPEVTIEQATAELETIVARLDRPDRSDLRVQVQTLHEWEAQPFEEPLSLLLGAVGFVLLIACANVAGLLLGRGAARSKEMATRVALGAGRRRLVRQLLTEGLVLALAGAASGVVLALVGVKLLLAIAPDWYPPAQELRIDGTVLGFALAVAVLTGILFSLIPALRASRPDPNSALKVSSGGSERGSRTSLRNVLVVSEVAVALVLMIGTGLMVNSLVRLLSADIGFDPDNLLVMRVQVGGPEYFVHEKPLDDDGRSQGYGKTNVSPRTTMFYDRLVDRIKVLQGVESVALTSRLPAPGGRMSFTIVGREAPAGDEQPRGGFAEISDGYFRTVGIPLMNGREFNEQDTRASAGVVIVSESLVQEYFPGEDPIGQHIQIDLVSWGAPGLEPDPVREIVGIAADVSGGARLGSRPAMYVPYRQHLDAYPEGGEGFHVRKDVVIRSRGDGPGYAALRQAVADIDRNQLVRSVSSVRESLSATAATERFWMRVLGVFAGLALVLAMIGIYGVVSYAVAQRTHEIGVRMALGAQRTDVLKMVLRQGGVLIVSGVIVGVLGAVAATRLLQSWLYGIEPTDPATFATVAAVLVGIALLATCVPARGATRVDPVNAMRSE